MRLLTGVSDDYFRYGKLGAKTDRSEWDRNYERTHARQRANHKRGQRHSETRIAVLDLETDPFDPVSCFPVHPFLAILYSEDFDPIIMWENDWHKLMHIVKTTIMNLPQRYIIYAHNGGRFDYMFLLHELRGELVFKGRALMSAKIDKHELRDSFHILPEKLQAIGGKDQIDYQWMKPKYREKHREAIITYCLADCRYLYDSVKSFRDKFGSPLTIGQAAMRELKREYDVENLSEQTDAFLRQWFNGGRVECRRYGMVSGTFNLFDVNSMYPYVMAKKPHPISREFFINNRIRPGKTAFITLRCKNNGALVSRAADGSLSTGCREGIFNTTIFEYETALDYALITDVEIIRTIEFKKFSTFDRFVEPIYNSRQLNKRALDKANRLGDNFRARELRYDVLFAKLLLNNAYGKFAQNPRRFKDHYICDAQEPPPTSEWGFLPEVETDDYCIYAKSASEFRFNNVATAASITGAARAELLAAIATSRDTLYCDTDSLICGQFSDTLRVDPYELGAWDCEAKISTFIGNGKKLYAYERSDKEPPSNRVVRAKGIAGVTWEDMLAIANGKYIRKTLLAPTIGKDGRQQYISRELGQTGVELAAQAR